MSKISKSIVISEFLWLLFFAVVFLKFDYTRTTLAVVNAIIWLCIVLVFSIIILQSSIEKLSSSRRPGGAEVNLAKRYLEVTLTNIFQDIDMLPTVNYNVNALPMRRIGQH